MATSYIPPIIEVFQEFQTAGAIVDVPLLQGVVVGPSYRILTYDRDKDLISVGDYDKVSGNTFFAPTALPGMQLMATDLKVFVDDANVEIDAQVDGAFTFGDTELSDIISSATADYIVAKVQVGDDVTLENTTGDIFTYKVLKVIDANKLQLNKNIQFIQNEIEVIIDISRLVDDKEIADTFYTVDTGLNSVTLSIGVTVTEDEVQKTLLSGKLYMQYKALDVTHANIPVEISSAEEVEQKLGIVAGDSNPLAMGALVTFSNSQKKIYALALQSDDLIGWTIAVDEIKRRGYYAKAILSQDLAVISLFKVLEEANQDSKIAKYGISVGTHKVEELEELELTAGTTGATLNDGISGLDIIFQDNDADFFVADIFPGDHINLVGAQEAGNPFIVDEVINGNKLKVIPTKPFTALESGLTYTIDRILDEEQLAERIAAVSTSLKMKRIVMSFPDYCQIAGEKLPGYYCACVVVGMIVGLPPNAGITYKGAAIVERVFNSNFRFDDAQLNIIAGGGTLVFMQDDEASLPYIRHQLTTDRTTLETSEISAIKNNDFVSFVFKATMKKFLGIYNVQEGLFITLRPALAGDIETLERTISTELGPILISGEIIELKQSEFSKDQIEVVIETVQPAPFNRGILRILA